MDPGEIALLILRNEPRGTFVDHPKLCNYQEPPPERGAGTMRNGGAMLHTALARSALSSTRVTLENRTAELVQN